MSFTHVAPRASAAAAHHTEFHELPANDRVLARVTSRPRVELQNLVSHTTQDDASLCASLLAKGISEALIAVNVPTFFDATALHGGVVWGRAIEASICCGGTGVRGDHYAFLSRALLVHARAW